ncbi:unnamed protein product [Rotaria magnacalcarata]|uniref:Uncharacterized protein n=3 Tax=Rotaria magnacalcarata TaxID=392030 RepID=A0A816VSI4_9BILA|nr:unnamed protein product [Rotaria magnacalcarata]CAF1305198.1 unnamed protein product [Rotaria magnacalcarata]CAF2021875.1 unnamed protein product [Rotaria magnacalcarata]CAF2127340.1 unnamed protein product [Rotaria magnacalcarata]CAF3842815.1 unnamed protein product [Rotaria magnacalcarata]
MDYSIIIYFIAIFIQITVTFEYNDDYDVEQQVASQSFVPISEPIDHLSSSIFDSLSQSNLSLASFLFTDHTINLDGLGISNIEPNTFVNYRVPVTTIILASNFLSYLPNNIFQPFSSTLINLNLQHNQFRSLFNNYFLRHLEQLRTLDLSKNQLHELHKQDFTDLRRLETLILRENKLTCIPYAIFSRCRTITTLDLSDNQISIMDPNAFRSLYRLKTLLLSNNPLGQRLLTHQLMEPIKNLEYLDLENTQLNDLSPFLFISNQHLLSIKLRRNNFQTKVNDSSHSLQRTFCRADSLIEIDLVSTHLRSLDVCTYDQVPSLQRLYLMNNPLHCTCDLFYLKYGDIYRVLLTDGNGVDRVHTDIDTYLDRWISRPELRRHLEKAHARGDFYRLPIELSLFARCATPKQWLGREIGNITGIFTQCQQRWSHIEQECQNYCQLDKQIEASMTTIKNTSLRSIQSSSFFVELYFVVLAFRLCI